MTTVLEYLEEETAFIPDPDMPASVANSEITQIIEAVFIFEVTRPDDDDEDFYEHKVLEITAGAGDDSVSFILISPNDEEWLYYEDIDSYISDTYSDQDEVSYNYEVLSDETL
jgi:hypothetical protein